MYTNRIQTRNGFTVVELIAAMLLVSVCIVGFSQLVFMVVDLQNAAQIRGVATDQLQNIMELIPEMENAAENPVPTESMRRLASQALPEGEIEFESLPITEVDDAMLLKGTVSWNDAAKRLRKNVSMVRLVKK